jgi:hypothetical protein
MEETALKTDMSGYMFKTKDEAEKAADEMGLKGAHAHKMEDGSTLYMPGDSHESFMKARKGMKDGHKKTKYQAARDAMYKKMLKDKYKYSSESQKDSEAVEEVEASEPAKTPYAAGFDAVDTNIGRVFDDVL